MRLGLFIATFGGLGLVLLLALPLPYGPTGDLPAAVRAHVPTPYCLQLYYSEPEDAAYLPFAVRLEESIMFRGTAWRRGTAFSRGWEEEAWWRPVDPDSLDITWYHGKVIRLPINPDSVAGTVSWAGVAPLFAWPSRIQTPASGKAIDCDALAKPAA
jgi:hypothetical protein